MSPVVRRVSPAPPLMPEPVSDVVGRIYDCVIEPSLWEGTLLEIARMLNCGSAILSCSDLVRDRLLISKSAGWEPDWLAKRQRHLPEVHDVLARWLAGRPPDDEPFVASRELPPSALATSPYVRECLGPLGITDVAHFFLMRTQEIFSELVVFRQAEQDVITAGEIRLGQMLLPHLRRAVAISQMLDVKTLASTTMERALDALAIAVLLVDDDLRVMHVNQAGQAALASGDAIFVRAGRLATRAAGVDAALSAAVAQIGAARWPAGRQGLGVPLKDRTGANLVLNVLPLRQAALRSGFLPNAVAAIFIASPRPAAAASDAFKALFELTPAEGAVLDHAAVGQTNAQTAEALGVSLATVKTHLQHIFDKTGVRRRAELVKLVASFGLPLKH